MTPQPNTHTHPDARIDQVLNALRTTQPPAGLEERIAARLAQAAESRTHSATFNSTSAPTARSFFAVILNAVKDPHILPTQAKLYATAATALTLLVTLTIVHNHTITTPSAVTTQVAQGFSLGSHRAHQEAEVLTPTLSQAANVRVPRAFVTVSHDTQKTAGVLPPVSEKQPDPDAIALAETQAPSLAAPPMPLTPQEQLIASATRPGQPIQLAELDTARQPYLRAEAKARTNANIQRYIRNLLAPFAVADTLQPTTFAQPQETSAPAPAPQPLASLSN